MSKLRKKLGHLLSFPKFVSSGSGVVCLLNQVEPHATIKSINAFAQNHIVYSFPED